VDDERARARVARVEELLDEVEALGDARATATATELVQALLDLYGEGLARVLGHAAEVSGPALANALAGDELVSHLLLVHDLHPTALEDRVREALAEVRPYLDSHGGDVELLSVDDGVAHLRMRGSCDGCPSSAATLKLAIEDAIHRAAPEIEEVRAAGEPDALPTTAELPYATEHGDAIPLPIAGDGVASGPPGTRDGPGSAGGGAWETAGALPELADGGTLLKRVAGAELLFLKLGAAVYAYRPDCPSCGDSLAGARLSGSTVACHECGGRYDARRAGRRLDQSGRPLEPVPLLTTDAGLVKVALAPAAAA